MSQLFVTFFHFLLRNPQICGCPLKEYNYYVRVKLETIVPKPVQALGG
jgi:hypothetical protein